MYHSLSACTGDTRGLSPRTGGQTIIKLLHPILIQSLSNVVRTTLLLNRFYKNDNMFSFKSEIILLPYQRSVTCYQNIINPEEICVYEINVLPRLFQTILHCQTENG